MTLSDIDTRTLRAMNFPYGLRNCNKIIQGGSFYQDRTDRIPFIAAAGDQLIFIRPRRFGKRALLYREGLLKTVFKAVKATAGDLGLDQALITGVSPVVLSDMTSGYNLGEGIYLKAAFNNLCGFAEAGIAALLERLAAGGWPGPRQALAMRRTFYNGYCFSENGGERLYNPTLSLYSLNRASSRWWGLAWSGWSGGLWSWRLLGMSHDPCRH